MEVPANEAPKSRRVILLGGVGAVLLALAGGAYVLLGLGGTEVASEELGTPTRQASAAPSRPTASPAVTAPGVSVVGKEPVRRDPFRPLYKPAPPPTTAPTGPTPPGVPADPNAPGVPTSPDSPTAPEVVITLRSIGGTEAEPTVTFTVGDSQITAKTDEVVGGVLKILSIRVDDKAATFQLGDETFDLRIGQSHTL